MRHVRLGSANRTRLEPTPVRAGACFPLRRNDGLSSLYTGIIDVDIVADTLFAGTIVK